jgi:hypothetical protein
MTNSARDDGELAEIQTVGIEGIEKNLLLKAIRMHRGDTSYSANSSSTSSLLERGWTSAQRSR